MPPYVIYIGNLTTSVARIVDARFINAAVPGLLGRRIRAGGTLLFRAEAARNEALYGGKFVLRLSSLAPDGVSVDVVVTFLIALEHGRWVRVFSATTDRPWELEVKIQHVPRLPLPPLDGRVSCLGFITLRKTDTGAPAA